MKQLNNNPIINIEAFRVELRLFERAIERLNQSNCCLGINTPQCHTIMEIGLAHPLSVNELADKMNLDKSTVSRQVEKLVQKGIVERVTAAADRRRVHISLTPKGKDIYTTMNQSMNESLIAAFQSIPEKEVAVFMSVFSKISRLL